MAYLEASEYVAYGLGAETSDAWVVAASAMIDAHCRRPSLLLATYTERLRLQRRNGTAQLTYGPVGEITALSARFGLCSQKHAGDDLLPYALTFGLPGQWTTLDPTNAVLDATGGELALPTHLFGLPYSEVEVTYTAGVEVIPTSIKVACAQIVKNAQATPGLNVRSSKLDSLQTQYFSDSLLDSQVRASLRPFVAERMG